MEIKDIQEGIFYHENTFPLECCESCADVHFEKTYPAHTAYFACTNLACECHNPNPLEKNT